MPMVKIINIINSSFEGQLAQSFRPPTRYFRTVMTKRVMRLC